MTRLVLIGAVVAVVGGGCGKKEEIPARTDPAGGNPPALQPPRAVVKRVPCKLKFGPIAAALEVDLSEVRNLALDAQQLYDEIVRGSPGPTPPAPDCPVVMVVNKKGNTFTYFQLTPSVKEIRLRTQDSREVELVVKNQEPLKIELWVNTDKPIDIDVEFKDGQPGQPKS
ncbi:MAG: hypothetical protein JWO38_2556 [Gemmataceae bacterium]|nr:hypothetical protein [Gemmataceae bacterium]